MGASMKMLLANESISARSAQEVGLVYDVVARDLLDTTAFAAAERLAGIPGNAVAAVKRAVNEGLDSDITRGLELELRLARTLMRQQLAGK